MSATHILKGEKALFVYGTLLEPGFRGGLLGHQVSALAARLPNYERRRKRHFFLAPRPGGAARGAILLDLSAQDFAILDRYEEVPALYTRELVEAVLDDSRRLRCWCYLPTADALT